MKLRIRRYIVYKVPSISNKNKDLKYGTRIQGISGFPNIGTCFYRNSYAISIVLILYGHHLDAVLFSMKEVIYSS